VTRKRHNLLPQPKTWFKNLVACMGDRLQIRVARKDGKAIAAVLSLRHGATVVYKYGCSDESLHNLGAMPFLIWRLIEESKASGAQTIDFGRTDTDNAGLTVFKDRLGAIRSSLTYYRYAKTAKSRVAALSNSKVLRQFFGILPGTVRGIAGRILYRHLG
jgi:lipid II:glycine glycyltransferase (peptidoglycan interpeptide bridge formation enzyme)